MEENAYAGTESPDPSSSGNFMISKQQKWPHGPCENIATTA
jgi:hypothetical protein